MAGIQLAKSGFLFSQLRQLALSTGQSISCKTRSITEKLCIAVVLAALSAAMLHGKPAWGGAAPTVSGSPPIEISIQGELLTVYAKNATLEEVLLAIGNTIGLDIVIRGGLPPERATWSFIDFPLGEIIRCLIGNYNRVMYYGASDRNKVSKLFVYGESDGSAGEQPPSRPGSEPQGSAEINLQIKAIEAILGVPDASARTRVVSSLESIESDRILPMLGQILFGDPDPGVRLAAVEALARQRGEGAVALLEAATKDKDTVVRDAAAVVLERKR